MKQEAKILTMILLLPFGFFIFGCVVCFKALRFIYNFLRGY